MTMMSDVPVFYDCEASCIGGLPIEIGWAFISTSTGEIQSESHLITPPLHWDMRPVWDPDAEKLHGISLKELLAHGRLTFPRFGGHWIKRLGALPVRG
jgi:hypothetical protein